jgi:uncharacterized protein YjbJ (UPF0337 family)
MTIAESERRSPGTPAPVRELHEQRARAVRRMSGAIALAGRGATTVLERVPGAVRATWAGAHGATSALQGLPDSTLRWIAAASVGLGAGLRLAGAPRLVSAAGAAPALIVGAAIALRPIKPDVPTHEGAAVPPGGIAGLTDEHTRGAISTAEGKSEEGLATLTGGKERPAHGRARQVQGATPKSLGDVQDAIRGPKGKA